MSYTIIVDSSAQLPESFIKQRPITVLPVTITLNEQVFQDYRSESKLVELYESGEITVDTEISSTPISGDELTNFMLEKIIPNYDTALCQTVAKVYSDTYLNYSNSISSILIKSRQLRHQLKLERPFRMTYMSSGNTSSGQGLVAAYADSLIVKGYQYNQYKFEIELFKEFAKTYTTIKDMVYGRHKAIQRGVRSVSYATARVMDATGVVPIICNSDEKMWMVAIQPKFEKAVNRIFSYAMDRIKEGLYFKTIIVSIAADIKELNSFSGFYKLKNLAEKEGVTLLVNVMSLAIASNYGPSSFSLGIAPKNTMVEP